MSYTFTTTQRSKINTLFAEAQAKGMPLHTTLPSIAAKFSITVWR